MSEVSESEAVAAESVGSERRFWRGFFRVLGRVAFWLLLVLGAIFVGAAFWIRRTFGQISVDQMLMNIDGGTEAVPENYVQTFLWQAIVLPVVLLIAVTLTSWFARRTAIRLRARPTTVSSRARRRTSRWVRVGKPLTPVAVFVAGLLVFVQVVGLDTYIRSITSSVTMEDYYVVPEVPDVTQARMISPETSGTQATNLVLIFLESGEEAFGDSALFGRNLNEPLEDVTHGWQQFEDLETYQGGGWTMAGIVGTECGVPLRGAGFSVDDINSNDIGQKSSSYLPNAVCLGDVLAGAGYRNVFMGGADTDFASKGDFLRAHGYDEIMDLGTWEEVGEGDMSPWGLSDGRLMEHAKEKMVELHEQGQPFNLTLLTVDPHEPAFMHEYCPTDSEDETEKLAAATACSLEQVAGFVQFMSDEGFLEDTAVFITGDHPKMLGEGRPFYEELNGRADRRLFNRLWDPNGVQIEQTSIDQLSVYATLLDVLGYGRSDHRAGIGVSALVSVDGFADSNDQNIMELTEDEYSELLSSRSAGLYQNLWREGSDSYQALGQ